MSALALGVLVSGSGTNLQAIFDAIEARRLSATVAVVISNVPGVKALERARDAGVPSFVVPHRAYATREAFDAALVELLRAHGVTCVVLAGFLRIVTPSLLDAFPDRVVNVHPALLPSFPGLHAQKQALSYGVKVAGCTVHLVDAGMDTGPILAQGVVAVHDDDDEPSLRARILAKEHELLPRVLEWFAMDRVHVEAAVQGERRRVRVSGEP